MSTDDFHDRPFSEGTLTKLQIFELYIREWLPVFLSRAQAPKSRIHVYDFFAGPGTDSQGQLGSPLRILRQFREFSRLPGWASTRSFAHFFDEDVGKIAQLRATVTGDRNPVIGLSIEVERKKFDAALSTAAPILRDRDAAKLLFIDQFGVDTVTPEVFRTMVSSPTCDFLFFLSSSTLYRFREHPAIKQKITRPDDYYQLHRATLDYYRGLLPDPSAYYLAPFSLKKGSNIYGLIFGSAHPLGMDKFLQVAWQADQINGEADFDIHRDNIQPNQLRLDLEEFRPTKVKAFERQLEDQICTGAVRDEREVVDLCFRYGVRRQHAEPVLAALKARGVIKLSFRVPRIERLIEPRRIELR